MTLLPDPFPYLNQLWAIEPTILTEISSWAGGMSLQEHAMNPLGSTRLQQSMRSREESGNIATIHISGVLMKGGSCLSASTSTIFARREIQEAARSPHISGILLVFDSPGGTVAGIGELGDEIAKAAATKPTWAYVEDLCASAAYWAASQTTKIYSKPMALVGGIGVYGVMEDSSKMAERLGITVHIVRAGEFKGDGYPGTAITAEILEERQQQVNTVNEHFLAAVAKGRRIGLARAKQLGDGRIHLGQAAVDLGLVDGVQSLDETFAQLKATGTPPAPPKAASSYVQTPPGQTRVSAVLRNLDPNVLLPDPPQQVLAEIAARVAQLVMQAGAGLPTGILDGDWSDREHRPEVMVAVSSFRLQHVGRRQRPLGRLVQIQRVDFLHVVGSRLDRGQRIDFDRLGLLGLLFGCGCTHGFGSPISEWKDGVVDETKNDAPGSRRNRRFSRGIASWPSRPDCWDWPLGPSPCGGRGPL